MILIFPVILLKGIELLSGKPLRSSNVREAKDPVVGCIRDGILRRVAPQNDMQVWDGALIDPKTCDTVQVYPDAQMFPYRRRGGACPSRAVNDLNAQKMYGDFVKTYDFAVHLFL